MPRIVLLSLLLFIAPSFAKSTILVGVDHAPPYSRIDDDGNIQGLILDILYALPQSAEYDIQPIACPFSRCVRMLSQGEIDIMGGLINTKERQKIMSFVEPPYMVLQSSFVFYKRADSELVVENYDDLYNKRIAVMRGGVFFPRFDEDRELNKVSVNTEKVAIDLLLKNRVDLVIAVEETADHSMSILNQPSHQLKKVDFRYTQKIYGNMAMSLKFAHSYAGLRVRDGMMSLALSNQLSQLVAPYQLPPIPLEIIPKI
ncbi:transporter substrate-binding domain-containing protein [Pseudoalteromonas xiamenensis]|uniref:substrate-binding periplasmic protein n=1 Tax=Pseudoalteromonas xiamenensis TaxID=882626 RepID=UPI0027E4451E|nr:transporter substrate-binding domain-containing protein [Pseudoalteromonas xiamenensis]WMN58973.1 transporter substrate-binding domain-containing protein [Pseudoalteromonas xiamenensis]